MTRAQVRAEGTIDRELVARRSDEDLKHDMVEDMGGDYEPAALAPSPRFVREKLGLTQEEIAVPVTSWRDWEEGRFKLEAMVVALLRILEAEPEVALRVLRRVV